MRIVPTLQCPADAVLGKTLYTDEGHILLREGVKLTRAYITRLYEFGYDFILIEDSITSDIIYHDVVSDGTRIQMFRTMTDLYRKLTDDKQVQTLQDVPYLTRGVKDVMSIAVDEVMRYADKNTIMTMNMGVYNHFELERSFIKHSMNVCIYSLLLGLAYGYTKDELMTLGLGALFADVGNTKIQEKKLFTKPHRLTSLEIGELQRHTEIGYRMMKDDPMIPLVSAHCAYQHHERIDGSGYPRGMKGNEIHEFARWIGIVDAYVAMTTPRSYRPAISPHHAIEVLYAGAGTLFDQDKVKFFRDKVAIYPVGITVTLNTGEKAVVSKIPSTKHRPVVRVFQDENGYTLPTPYEIDLSQNLTMMIDQLDGFTTLG